MLLAVSTMSPGTQAVLFGLAVVLLVVAAVIAFVHRALIDALAFFGLALFVLVFFWNALAAS